MATEHTYESTMQFLMGHAIRVPLASRWNGTINMKRRLIMVVTLGPDGQTVSYEVEREGAHAMFETLGPAVEHYIEGMR